MTTEEKQALFAKLPGILQGANIGQLNMIVESGAKVVYQEQHFQGEQKPANSDANQKPGKEAIMEYLWRLKPVVREQYLSVYGEIWDGILELHEVKMQIYQKGKQQDTTFNRNLLAQIIHQVSDRLYLPTANTVKMAEYLEPEKGMEHPVRQKLGESPEKPIKKAVDEYMKDKI